MKIPNALFAILLTALAAAGPLCSQETDGRQVTVTLVRWPYT